ncbi:beta-hexosaminidase [Fulvitalea axinellae]|uniref:beta-N-acetylhexosaminidase n=1 Tax=Fulvitalea axinellae TaxID=1182444 RepID=A0AAU9D969_9BACT|nr:beta-hexosaminidase [Fulvitalea axinellae]
MRSLILNGLVVFLLIPIVFGCNSQEKATDLNKIDIIPLPQDVIAGKGHFSFDKGIQIKADNEELATVATRFSDFFKTVSGYRISVEKEAKDADILVKLDKDLPNEAYRLDIKRNKIEIRTSSLGGAVYAFETLKQLFPPVVMSGKVQENVKWRVPAVSINDFPGYGWRGYMLDASRHFFTVEQVKKVLDFMAELKLNRFHWHLTDDQGWRVEIKSLPNLTEYGAWRVGYINTDERKSEWWGRPVQKKDELAKYGGYYSQDQIREIVRYAKERNIEVIPEVDFPGHAQAAVASYPEIGCVDKQEYVATGGVARNNTMNPGKKETYDFVRKVIVELTELFPYEYIHIGGDECNKDQWKKDPFVAKLMKTESLEDMDAVQSYFLKEVEKIVNSHGKKMMGWDEILDGGLAPNATVMSWRGTVGGMKSVKMGHDVVMSPNSACYLDLKQGQDSQEPNLGYGHLFLSDSYNYKLVPDTLNSEEAKRILGIQANMWTESITDWGKLTYMTFPRLHAIAEKGWTNEKRQSWDGFVNRLRTHMKRMDVSRIRYAKSAFNPRFKHEGNADSSKVMLTLDTEIKGLQIRYSLDSEEPDMTSTLYSKPFSVSETTTVKARTFDKEGKPMGDISALTFEVHKATGAEVTYTDSKHDSPESTDRLTDLNFASLDPGSPQWMTFAENPEFTIKLKSPVKASFVKFNTERFTIAGRYPAKKVTVWGLRSDNNSWTKLGEKDLSGIASEQGRNYLQVRCGFNPVMVKEVKVKCESWDKIPEGHHRAGAKPAMRIDELMVF